MMQLCFTVFYHFQSTSSMVNHSEAVPMHKVPWEKNRFWESRKMQHIDNPLKTKSIMHTKALIHFSIFLYTKLCAIQVSSLHCVQCTDRLPMPHFQSPYNIICVGMLESGWKLCDCLQSTQIPTIYIKIVQHNTYTESRTDFLKTS